MKLFLLRHSPVLLEAGICYGSSDVPATEISAEDLGQLRKQIPARAVIWSSPARRCRELAVQLAVDAHALTLDQRLCEMDFGQWEMRRFDDIERRLIDAWADDPWGFVPPGGESAAAMSVRVLDFLGELRRQQSNQPILILAHAGPLRVIRGSLTGLPREQWLAQVCEPARLSQLHCNLWSLRASTFAK